MRSRAYGISADNDGTYRPRLARRIGLAQFFLTVDPYPVCPEPDRLDGNVIC